MCCILLLLPFAVIVVATDVSFHNYTSKLSPDDAMTNNFYYSINVNGPLQLEYPRSGNCSTNKDCSLETACIDNYCVDPCSMCANNAICLTQDHTAACSCGDGLSGDPFTACNPEKEKMHGDPCTLCGNNTDCLAKNDTGVCSCKVGHTGDAFTKCIKVDCTIDDDCAQDRACVNNLCVDPCFNATCGTNTDCQVKNHTAACSCTAGHIGNPFTGCRLVDCTIDDECAQDRACVNNLCVDPCFNATCGTNTDCHAKNHFAACSCTLGHIGNPLVGCKLVGCSVNDECSQVKHCVRNQCVDPCSSGVCGPNTHCTVKDHAAACSCKAGYFGDPFSDCEEGVIPKDYIATDGKYYLYSKMVNWFNAFGICVSHGLRLATFQNADDYQRLVNLLKNRDSYCQFWIGASSLGDSSFKWLSTNSPLTYTRWSQGEPNQSEEEQCVELRCHAQYEMNNIKCTDKIFVVCEHM